MTTDSGKVFPRCDQLIRAAWQTVVGNYTEDTDVCEEGAHTYCNSAKDHWKGRKVRAQRVEDYDNYYSIKPARLYCLYGNIRPSYYFHSFCPRCHRANLRQGEFKTTLNNLLIIKWVYV